MSKRCRKALTKVLKILLAIAIPLVSYCVYVAPVFLEHGGVGCLTDERRYGNHNDYIKGLRWIGWRYTVICGIGPPVQDGGNQDYHDGVEHNKAPKPIPPAGERQLSHTDVKTKYWNVRLHYAAITLPGQYHARIGWRWDDVDNFYVFTISIKKIPINMDIHLLNWETHRFLAQRAQHKFKLRALFLFQKFLSPTIHSLN
jgi:hypothetical protein